ncbi:helix-turn-helix domain-containing protein [Streptomyces sp. NPDC002073]
MLVRTSRQASKDVAEKIDISPSYLSRLLSGERFPTWELTRRFARACGADPEVLRTVWETERLSDRDRTGPSPTVDEGPPLAELARLHQAIHTLHLRASRPTPKDIAPASNWALSTTEAAAVLEPGHLPPWPVVKIFAGLLGGKVDYFKDLWDAADAEQEKGLPGLPEETREPASGVEDVLDMFAKAFQNPEQDIVESQRARLLEKRAKQTGTRPKLADVPARLGAAGRGWTMKIAREGL